MSDSIHRVGLIGVGRMGLGLGRNLLRHGYAVRAFDPAPEALQRLIALGAEAATSVADTAATSDAIITCLPDIGTVRTVYLGIGGVLDAAPPGCLLIDMTSSDASLTREIGAAARAVGLGMVDAPMLRGAPQAWDGTVHVLLGGADADKARSYKLLNSVAERVTDSGDLGMAHALKAVNNAVTMANNAVLAEAMMAGRRLGFTDAQLVEVLAGGLSTRLLDLYAPRFLSGEHPNTAALRTCEKDLGLFLDLAGAAATATPMLAAAHRIYRTVCAAGRGHEPPSRLADLLGATAEIVKEDIG